MAGEHMAAGRIVERLDIIIEGQRHQVEVDLTESPLAWLARRRGREGRGFIDAVQLMAGERLRADFTRAQMMPRTTADWSGIGRGPARHAARTGLASGEAALAAKQRVAKAMEVVGPEFSGTLLDVCCFLKGIERVEQERGWPARSGKVVLGLGLDRLARHYGLSREVTGPARAQIRSWSAPESGEAGRSDGG
ncbi:DUF6456 domain-containing protein [Ancylobacter sp. Lp-2]|uniref:DUF6456 domain-containing protein n=1 Tax=Ancylobacter sp. Lp-2 TaxID=2881339 RepID=UPI001E57A8D1|nr:DUF6456 domain-containing protein [Ancylobacter sp. Lp-2]MCB4768954.1 DUF6456 domain-containing protein [Ancylobacter sp. Lp-2]